MIVSLPPRATQLGIMAGDALATAAAVAVALYVRHGGRPEASLVALYAFATPFLVGLWLAGFVIFGLYDLALAKNDRHFFERFGRAVLFNAIITFLLFHLAPEFRLAPKITMAIIAAVAFALLIAWRALSNAVLARTSRNRLLFCGVSGEVLEIAHRLRKNPQLGYEPVLAIHMNGDEATTDPSGAIEVRTVPVENIPAVARHERITTIVISANIKTNAILMRILFAAVPLGIVVVELPRFYELILGKVATSLIGEVWFLENLIGHPRPAYEFAKRIFDLTAAFVIGGLTILILPAVAAAIVLSTPVDILRWRERRAHTGDGIVFFRQKRIGRSGLPFGFIKFRSQILGAEKIGYEKSDVPDPRAYAAGTILRKTYLDELPQVWNIIKGEMSFVGPRPERPEFVRELEGRIPFYRIRELVTPGITGWAQINMENDASVSDAPEKLQYDLYYLKHRSLFLDALILAKTALKLMQRSGR